MSTTRKLMGSGTSAMQAEAIVGRTDRNVTATGTDRQSAYVLSEDVTIFTSVAVGTGAALRSNSIENDIYTIINQAASPLNIYPPEGGIVGGAVNSPYVLAPASYVDLQALGSNRFMVRAGDVLGPIAAPSGAGLVGFSHAESYPAGTLGAKEKQIISPLDAPFNAAGDGVSDDTIPIAGVKLAADELPVAMVNFSNGRYKTAGTFWQNNISPTVMYFDKASGVGLFDGTYEAPNTVDNDPVLWAQKYTQFDNGTDRFAHNVGGLFGSVFAKGSRVTGAIDTDGTWIGILGNSVINGLNQGTPSSPDFDAYGNSIGIAGFARSTGYPGSGNIVCGTWGYAEGPTLDAITYANLPATNWTLVGSEVNVQINHPDLGPSNLLVGKGSSVGILNKNYRTPGTGVMDWTFGQVFDGTPNDNNYTGTDVALWSGFYTGILLDKIKSRGILFGKYAANGSYGIEFPSSYSGYAQRPAAAIYVGDNVINMAQYTGGDFNDQDFWHNGGFLFFRFGGTSERIVSTRAGVLRLGSTQVISVAGVNAGAFSSNGDAALAGNFGGEALRAVRVANAVNRCQVFGAPSGNAVVYGADGESTVAIEYRSKGTARQFWTINGSDVGSWDSAGNFLINVAGRGLRVKEGTNAKQGVATLVAGTVIVANTSVTANSTIFLSAQDNNTTGALRVANRIVGTSLTITSNNETDTGVVAYEIFEPA
jgi:hypothetical protein